MQVEILLSCCIVAGFQRHILPVVCELVSEGFADITGTYITKDASKWEQYNGPYDCAKTNSLL